jgi:hypothetical protein
MKPKFFRETITIERPEVGKSLQEMPDGFKTPVKNSERIIITIEFIGYGNTSELKTEELLKKAMNKIGDAL